MPVFYIYCSFLTEAYFSTPTPPLGIAQLRQNNYLPFLSPSLSPQKFRLSPYLANGTAEALLSLERDGEPLQRTVTVLASSVLAWPLSSTFIVLFAL